MTGENAGLGSGKGAGSRTRFEKAHRKSRSGFACRYAAAGQHDEEAPYESGAVQSLLQLCQVIRYSLLNVDIRQGRARALKLADLSDHFRTERHADGRGNLSDDLSRTQLVC